MSGTTIIVDNPVGGGGIGGSTGGIPSLFSVVNFAALPPFADHIGEFYFVENTTGLWGFGRKKSGYYRSTGLLWEHVGNSSVEITTQIQAQITARTVATLASPSTTEMLSTQGLANILAGNVRIAGTFDASQSVMPTNAIEGSIYRVTVSGNVGGNNLDGIDNLNTRDWIIFTNKNADNNPQNYNNWQMWQRNLDDQQLTDLFTDLFTIVGQAALVGHMGTYPGAIITDNVSVKQALVELEAFAESLASSVSNVDNTSDVDKPVSTAQGVAIAAVQTNLTTHEGQTNNPHTVTLTQAVAADGSTDVTGAELQTLTGGAVSNADLLHVHQQLVRAGEKAELIDGIGSLNLSGYGTGRVDPRKIRFLAGLENDGTFAQQTVNQGQVKINGSGGIPITNIGWTNDVAQTFLYNSGALNLSASPTTQWPLNIITPTDGNIVDGTTFKFLENPILGQVHLWRIEFRYSNKGGNNNMGLTLGLWNPNTGFIAAQTPALPSSAPASPTLTMPGGAPAQQISSSIILVTIADTASIGNGYFLIGSTTNDDGNMNVVIDSVTRTSTHHIVR